MKRLSHPNALRHSQQGSIAVEVALVSGLLALLMAGAFVLGRLYWQYNRMTSATWTIGRYLSADAYSSDREAFATKQLVDALEVNQELHGVKFSVTCKKPDVKPDCNEPGSDSMSVVGDAPFADPSHIVGDGWGVSSHVTVEKIR